MKRKLISSDEAVPVSKQPTAPCSDCPFARDSLNGWLGESSPEEYRQLAHSDARIDCHTMLDVQCAGAAIYRANIGKLSRNRSVLRLPCDATRVFTTPAEFVEHHSKMPTKPAERKHDPQHTIDEITSAIEEACCDLPRAKYREVLEEVSSYINVCLEAIDEDDKRERRT